MVLEIRLSNFYSIKEEVILDLRAGKIQTARSKILSQNITRFEDIEVLKTIAIYGANASGKSNIIEAIRFCNSMVFNSHNHNENSVFNFKKFKGFSRKPSSYSIRFVLDKIEYIYAFTLNRTGILTESLYYYPNGRITKVFDRDEKKTGTKREKYSFGTSVINRPYDVVENTSDKTLYISRASQLDREIPKEVFNFFYRTFILRHSNYSIQNLEGLLRSHKNQLLQALQMADSDIIDFKPSFRISKGKSIKTNLVTEETFIEDTELPSLEIKTYHKHAPNTAFDFITEESAGTKKLFLLMLTILDVVSNNKTLLIDEIEDSLHPKIVEYIIQLFNASNSAQLIFTTHNTNLLDLNKFRKDQIWFVDKKEDGGSELYSLYDYNDFRDNMNLEKAYLQGRFDSVPIVNDSINSLQSLISD